MQHGIFRFDWNEAQLVSLAETEADPRLRFNDGKCDAHGRFWAGTMRLADDGPTGALYCLDPDGSLRTVLQGISISNGLGWSPDHQTMYFIDTPTRTVMAFDYDLDSGTPSNPRVFATIDDGSPDGMCVDSDGCLWIAHWGGAKISRWHPRSGQRIEEWKLPVSLVTSCAFGGANRDELYVTTARSGLSPQQLRNEPDAGSLFVTRVPAQGQPSYAFQG